MRTLSIILLTLSSLVIYGQETKPIFDGHHWQAPYGLPIPKDWTIERFLIPISFAPQIPYNGVEDIRFTPGWSKATGEEYWTYAFLWYLDGKIPMNAKTIDRNLQAYYTGLLNINGQNISKEKLIPVETSFREIKKARGDQKTFTGTIKMLDYMTQKPILLYCKAHVKSCPGVNKTFMFYELSPQPFVHQVWISLDQLWLGFTCKKD